jgi:NTP pyrophosphatase (non-canonical NTP hydrolase)
MTGQDAANSLDVELAKADRKYGDFHSTHEGFGVLAEEVAELLEAIHRGHRRDIETEAIQVAAVALRIAKSLNNSTTRDRSGLRD